MKSTGIIRPVDKMGRVVIPKEIRKHLNIVSDVDNFEIYVEEDKIILKKYNPSCVFCDNLTDIVEYEGFTVCGECIKKLNDLKNE